MHNIRCKSPTLKLFFKGKEKTPSLGKFHPTEAKNGHHFPHSAGWRAQWPWWLSAALVVSLKTRPAGWGRPRSLNLVSQERQVTRGRWAPGLETRPSRKQNALCLEPVMGDSRPTVRDWAHRRAALGSPGRGPGRNRGPRPARSTAGLGEDHSGERSAGQKANIRWRQRRQVKGCKARPPEDTPGRSPA